jgi:hypothetical protein
VLWTWVNFPCLIVIYFLFCEFSCSDFFSLKFNILDIVYSHPNNDFISGIDVYLGVNNFQYECLVLFIVKIYSPIYSLPKLSSNLDKLTDHVIRYFWKVTLVLICRDINLRRWVLCTILLGRSPAKICKFEILTSFIIIIKLLI